MLKSCPTKLSLQPLLFFILHYLFNAVNAAKAKEAFGRIKKLDLIERVLCGVERGGHNSFHG